MKRRRDKRGATLDPTGFFLSEKYDGVRAFWDPAEEALFSRLGNRIHAPSWFTKGFPKELSLDGELWLGRERFQDTVSVVKTSLDPDVALRRKRKAPPSSNVLEEDAWKDIQYLAFDCPSEAQSPFETRLELLQQHIPTATEASNTSPIAVVSHRKCTSTDDLIDALAKIEAGGGEGIMIRAPGSLYEEGRTSTLLKVKRLSSDEGMVMSYTEGQGRNEERVGAIVCLMRNGMAVRLGSGLTDTAREEPPTVGTIVTYRHMGVTRKGIPRFATLAGQRIDWDPSSVNDGSPLGDGIGNAWRRRKSNVIGTIPKVSFGPQTLHCPLCDQDHGIDEQALGQHFTARHGILIPSDVVSFVDKAKASMKGIVKTVKKPKPSEVTTYHQCPICDSRCNNIDNLSTHIMNRHAIYEDKVLADLIRVSKMDLKRRSEEMERTNAPEAPFEVDTAAELPRTTENLAPEAMHSSEAASSLELNRLEQVDDNSSEKPSKKAAAQDIYEEVETGGEITETATSKRTRGKGKKGIASSKVVSEAAPVHMINLAPSKTTPRKRKKATAPVEAPTPSPLLAPGPQTLLCTICEPDHGTDQKALGQHLTTHHGILLSADVTALVAKAQAAMVGDLNPKKGKDDTIPSLRCPICDQKAPSKDGLHWHLMHSHGIREYDHLTALVQAADLKLQRAPGVGNQSGLLNASVGGATS
ncbi:hypothetical protein HKX48_009397 [Thoreauomyces humboldtii]|nr:hypothetical protein HKX48_009397 [Thoreauomyces humboldtii]